MRASCLRRNGVAVSASLWTNADDRLALDPLCRVECGNGVVEADRAQLGEVVQRVRDGRLRTNIGNVATLDEAVAAFNPTERVKGKTIIRVRP